MSIESIRAITENAPATITQTYATADATHAARTAAALTDSSGGSVSTTLAAVTAPTALTAASGTADATVSDVGATFNQTTLNNNFQEFATAQAANRAALVALTNAVASLADQVNKLRADGLDTAQLLNSVVDNLQTQKIVG